MNPILLETNAADAVIVVAIFACITIFFCFTAWLDHNRKDPEL